MSQIIGVVLAILLGMMSLPQLMTHSRNANNNIIASNIAQQAIQFNDAVARYVQTYPTQIQSVATATTPLVITVGMLQATGFLSNSFHGSTAYGNTFEAQALQPTAGNLQVFSLTTGGDPLPDNRALKIANLIGNAGGFTPLNDTGLYAGGAANAYGTGWGPTSTTNFNVSGGQLASLLTFNNGQLADNRLYRNAVPGQPQLNTMNTPLIMGAGTIQTENTVCAPDGAVGRNAAGQVLSCTSGKWKQQGSSYWRDPVASFANLPTTDDIGTVRMALDTQRAFMWTGGGWSPLAVDQNGDLTVPGTLIAAGGTVVAWNNVSEGGVLQLNGANGTKMFLESLNGTFRLINDAWNKQLFSVDQNGNVVAAGRVTAKSSNYPLVLQDAAGANNASAKSAAGSASVNDIYVRSIGKWASEYLVLPSGVTCGSSALSSLGTTFIFARCDGFDPMFSCPANYSRTFISQSIGADGTNWNWFSCTKN